MAGTRACRPRRPNCTDARKSGPCETVGHRAARQWNSRHPASTVSLKFAQDGGATVYGFGWTAARPPIIRFAMQISDGEDDEFVRLHNVNHSVREPPQAKPPHAVAERMPCVRTLGDALPRRPNFIDEPPLEARRLGGVPCDRLIKFGGSRRQQPDVTGGRHVWPNISSKSSASSSPRR